MISGKDVNFNDVTHVLTINGEKHAVGDPGDIDALKERVTALEAVNTGIFTVDESLLPNAENNIIVRQVGKVISINGYMIKVNLPNPNTTYILGKLSNISMPPTNIRALGCVANAAYENGDSVYTTIGTDGTMAIKTRTLVGNSESVYFNITYIAN